MPKKITPTKPAAGKAKKKQPSLPQFDNERAEVRESEIHGLGLFAKKNLRKGAKVGVYEGEMVTSMKDDGDHVLWIYDEDEDREYGINGQNEMRYVDHSRGANANFNGEELIALRPIKAGEELTHDYGEAWADLD